LEVAHQLASEEVHDLLGAEAQRAVAEQPGVKIAQALAGLEHHVRGVFGLRRHPVVLAAVQHIAQLRHDLPGVSVQDLRPLQVGESIGQALCPWQVLDPGEDVIDFRVFDTAGGQLASEPLVPVEVDLDLQREPSLHANVDEAQIAIDEVVVVVVQVQALALGRLHIRLPGREAQRESAARLEGREHAHQSLEDAVTLGDRAGGIFLAQLGAQVLERPAVLAGKGHRMGFDALGVGQQERFDAGAVHLVSLDQLRHRPARHDRQVAAEQHSVEAGQHAVNTVLVLADRLVHVVLPAVKDGGKTTPSAPRSRTGRLGCGRRPR
jgi:hypothetical protein